MIKHYPLSCRPARQCTRALSPHQNVSFLLFLTFTGGGQLTQIKNDNKGKLLAVMGWPRSLNKGGHLSKKTITMFENSSLNTVKTNNQTKRIGKAFKKTNKQTTKQTKRQERHMKKRTSRQNVQERHMKKRTNIVKGTWQTFLIEFVCFYFLKSDSSVCSDIRGIRKRHPFSHAVRLT